MNTTKYSIPKKRVINLSNCQYWSEVYQTIYEELELPDWCGKNLDALWDSITGMMYVPADVTIIYKPETTNAGELASEINKIIDVFKEAAQKYNEITLQVET